jgi:hypothetical protein
LVINQVGGRLPHKKAEQWKVQYRELLGKAEIECPPPDKPAGSRVKFLPLAWAGMPKTSFRKNSDSPQVCRAAGILFPLFRVILYIVLSIARLFYAVVCQYDCTYSLCNAHHIRELTCAWEQDKQKWAHKMK